MPAIYKHPGKLSFARKLSRLAVRLRDPEWRRCGKILFAGKLRVPYARDSLTTAWT